MSRTQRKVIKERKPLPERSGHYHQDKKKVANKKACRKGQWE
jgi:hypothetical protein